MAENERKWRVFLEVTTGSSGMLQPKRARVMSDLHPTPRTGYFWVMLTPEPLAWDEADTLSRELADLIW